MPRKLLISKEIFFTLMEFNDYYFHFLNIVPAFTKYGYERIFVSDRPLLYFREDQVVARHLYILRKK